MKRTGIVASFFVLSLVLAVPASAQTTALNPTKVDWGASPDHNATNALTGQPLVSSYEFAAVAPNSLGAIAITRSLGKPAPDVAAGCSTPSPCLEAAVPELATITQNVLYTATIAVVGPSGTSAPTAPSNPFGRVGPPAAAVGKPTVK